MGKRLFFSILILFLVSGMVVMASGQQAAAEEEKAKVLKIVAFGTLKRIFTEGNGGDVIADFVKGKRYYDPTKAYLVLHPGHSFTINYSAP